MTVFILASGSPRRQGLLQDMGIHFEVVKPEIDESVHPGEPPETYVQRLSRAKAQAVAANQSADAYILAADTTVIHNGEILGKPKDDDDARRMLLRLRADQHRVCTGFTVLHLQAGQVQQAITRVVCTAVIMRFYAASDMENWINSGAAYDKAGGYAIQSITFNPVERIEGSYNNVVGLPTEAVTEALREIGYLSGQNNGDH
jgi:septum formation protein